MMRSSDQRGPLRPLALMALLVALAVLGVVLVLVFRGSSRLSLPGNAGTSNGAQFSGLILKPPQREPPLALRNYLGDPVNITSYRGKAVLVTFLYVHCPDACPLIAANLHNTLVRLGPMAHRVQVIAASVDPRGDTRATVAQFLKLHELVRRMKYLIGSPRQLVPVWKAWYVGSQRDVNHPESVGHTALVYGISASGKLLVVYDAHFNPADLARDVPKLASL